MESKEFNSIIIQYFDELKNKYIFDIENDWDGEVMGSTILIEDYLMPFIYQNIDNTEIMNRLSSLLEYLLALNDDFCENVLYCSFFEKIHYDKVESKFIKYFKKITNDFYKEIIF